MVPAYGRVQDVLQRFHLVSQQLHVTRSAADFRRSRSSAPTILATSSRSMSSAGLCVLSFAAMAFILPAPSRSVALDVGEGESECGNAGHELRHKNGTFECGSFGTR